MLIVIVCITIVSWAENACQIFLIQKRLCTTPRVVYTALGVVQVIKVDITAMLYYTSDGREVRGVPAQLVCLLSSLERGRS